MTHRSGQYRDQAAEIDAWYPGYPETVPASVTVGYQVYGRLGTDAEVGSWGLGTITEITEDRTEAAVRWPNGQVRQMAAYDIDFRMDKP